MKNQDMVIIKNKQNPLYIYRGTMQIYDKESFLFSFKMSECVWTAETLLYFDEWDIERI